ncbi:MAG: ABC transporter permease [Mesorhizobium sp.]|uniref:ABC transporter permease n=1 Tax=Mesorhizobium sp. TaxID=1871066 RepID=UPI000FE7786E|nr:ABC transporter permease [Mesorhizobium sp.]RWE22868.1 MAG: ABC transporter permease [Mesorhizobium sp.]
MKRSSSYEGRSTLAEATTDKRSTHKLPDWAIGMIWLVFVAAAWSLAIRLLAIPEYILPSPEQVGSWILTQAQTVSSATIATLKVVAVGILAGFLLALPVSLALAKIRVLEKAFYPFIVFFQTTPLITLTPVLIIWLGFGLRPAAVLVTFAVFFPVLVNAIAGLRSTPPRLYYVTKTMGASALQTFRFVDWFNALPYLLSALKIAVPLAMTTAVVSEFFAANDGLGFLALQGVRTRQPTQVISVVLVAAVIGVILQSITALIERSTMRRYR